MTCLIKGGEAVKMPKTYYYKSSLGTNLVLTYSLIFVCNVKHVVMIHLNDLARLN